MLIKHALPKLRTMPPPISLSPSSSLVSDKLLPEKVGREPGKPAGLRRPLILEVLER